MNAYETRAVIPDGAAPDNFATSSTLFLTLSL
jgi:hypothetical protein